MNIQDVATKRLLLATFVAIASMWLLGYLASFFGINSAEHVSPSMGHLDPVNLVVTAIAMCLGGYIGGKRFIGMALAIMCVLWIITVYVLLQIAKLTQADALPLPHIFAYNRMQIALSVLVACASAALGAWLRLRRAALRAAA
jgi:hypothetical protein